MSGTSNSVTSRQDYLPLGYVIPASVGGQLQSITDCGVATYGLDAGVTEKFTGKERDAGTGVDHFGARYYSAADRRFSSPDEPVFDQRAKNPRSWNLENCERASVF
jgi:RHS repeat-associated protein